MPATETLKAYLHSITGAPLALRPVGKPLVGLPAFLRRTYELLEGELLGQETVFALRREGKSTPKTLRAEYGQLAAATKGRMLVLVLEGITSSTRARLVQAGLPFIVPGRQTFLPARLVDLRERQPSVPKEPLDKLGWPAQVVLLRHLLHGDVQGRMLAEIAKTTGYSNMAISNAKLDLVRAGLAEVRVEGRNKRLAFETDAREVWGRAIAFLRKPWRKLHAVEFGSGATAAAPGVEAKLRTWIAGADALARTTSLTPGAIPTVAMATKELRHQLDESRLVPCPDADEADLLIEAWKFDPGLLATGETVDPLSLWLCLKDDPDERVQIALEARMSSIEW